MTTAQSLITAAWNQQKITGKKDADVAIVVKGKWPDSGRKRLFGKSGPWGNCMAEYEHDVLCLFKADEVIKACASMLPTIKMQEPRHAD